MIEIYNMDCRCMILENREKVCVVSDPPFNIGYKYRSYKDKMKENEYLDFMASVFMGGASVIIHYPETLYKIAIKMEKAPFRVVSWVYNSNTRRQHRDIAFFDVEPDFSKVKQPYKNPNDKRVKALIANGKKGANMYDWFEQNQVKNVSKDKTQHPCQMPLEVMEKIIGIIPKDYTIYDPFMGSGTTGLACARLGRNFIGCELDPEYFEIAKKRIYGIGKQISMEELNRGD